MKFIPLNKLLVYMIIYIPVDEKRIKFYYLISLFVELVYYAWKYYGYNIFKHIFICIVLFDIIKTIWFYHTF